MPCGMRPPPRAAGFCFVKQYWRQDLVAVVPLAPPHYQDPLPPPPPHAPPPPPLPLDHPRHRHPGLPNPIRPPPAWSRDTNLSESVHRLVYHSTLGLRVIKKKKRRVGVRPAQQLHKNVKRFRGGLVFLVHRLVYHSTLGWRVIKKKRR